MSIDKETRQKIASLSRDRDYEAEADAFVPERQPRYAVGVEQLGEVDCFEGRNR